MNKKRPLFVGMIVALVMVIALPALATFTPGFYSNKNGSILWDQASDGIVTGAFGCPGTGFTSGDTNPYGGDATNGELVEQGNAKDATYQLARHTIAAKLNVAFGACNAVWGTPMTNLVNLADAFLAAHPLGSDPQGADREYGLAIKTCLDLHNNIPDGTTAEGYFASEAYACYLSVTS